MTASFRFFLQNETKLVIEYQGEMFVGEKPHLAMTDYLTVEEKPT